MRFLLDNCMPKPASAMLTAYDQLYPITAIRDHFDPSIKDSEWIPQVGTWDVPPFILSGDGRILRNAVERQILKESQLTFFLMSPNWSHLSWNIEYAWRLVKLWPSLIQEAKLVRRPSVFEVAIKGDKIVRRANL